MDGAVKRPSSRAWVASICLASLNFTLWGIVAVHKIPYDSDGIAQLAWFLVALSILPIAAGLTLLFSMLAKDHNE